MLVDCHSVFKQSTKESCLWPQPSENSPEQTKDPLWRGEWFPNSGRRLGLWWKEHHMSGRDIHGSCSWWMKEKWSQPRRAPDCWKKGAWPGPLGTAFLIQVPILLGTPHVTNRLEAAEWLSYMHVCVKKLGEGAKIMLAACVWVLSVSLAWP